MDIISKRVRWEVVDLYSCICLHSRIKLCFGNFPGVIRTWERFINVIWVSSRSYANHFGKFDFRILQLFAIPWKCSVDNLTGLLFSREMVITTWVISYDGNMMIYAIFRKDEWFSLFPKFCEYIVFIGVLLSTHLLLKDSPQKQMDDHLTWFVANVPQGKLNELCSCPRIDLRKSKKTKVHSCHGIERKISRAEKLGFKSRTPIYIWREFLWVDAIMSQLKRTPWSFWKHIAITR